MRTGSTLMTIAKIALIGALITCTRTAMADTLRGKVTDEWLSTAIPGVTVRVIDGGGNIVGQATTNASGDYSISVNAGSYTARYIKSGYVMHQQGVTVSGTTTVDVALKPLLKGIVVDDLNNPLSAAQVSVVGTGITLLTGADGKYSIGKNIPAGSYNVSASKSGYLTETKPVTIVVTESKEVDFTLRRYGTIKGKVEDSVKSEAVENASVEAHRNGVSILTTTTDNNGEFQFPDSSLPPGNYTLVVSKSNFKATTHPETGWITLDPGETLDLSSTPIKIAPISIKGTVRDAWTLLPLANVTVSAVKDGTPTQTVTDGNGQYQFSGLEEESYDVTAQFTGYITSGPQNATVVVGTPAEVDFSMYPFIYGWVYDSTTGSGIANAQIEIRQNGAIVGYVLSQPNGRYSIGYPGVTGGEQYTLTVRASGYKDSDPQTITTQVNSPIQLNIALEPFASVKGIVVEEGTNAPIDGALVEVLDTSDKPLDPPKQAYTNLQGNFQITNIPAESYKLRVSKSGFKTITQDLTLNPGETKDLGYITLVPVGIIAGTVKDSVTGQPISGATVTVVDTGDTATTGADGSYKIPDVKTGTHTVQASAIGYVKKTVQNVLVIKGESVGVYFELDPGGDIIGKITDSTTTNPIQGALVEVLQGGVVKGQSQTKDNGDYQIQGLPPGTYNLRISKSAYVTKQLSGIEVNPGQQTTINTVLDPISVSGVITDGWRGVALSGALVQVFENQNLLKYTFSNAQGFYQITALAPGEYEVKVTKDGYVSQSQNVTVNEGQTTQQPFAVEPLVKGEVTDEQDVTQKLTGAVVEVYKEGQLIGSVLSDSNGRYSIGIGLQDGATYELIVKKAGYLDASEQITASLNASQELNFALTREGVVAGTITDQSTGMPLSDALVKVWDAQGEVVGQANTNANGYYSIGKLHAGTYTVSVSRDDYVKQEIENVNVQSGQTTTVDVALERAGAIAGRVTDALTGQPIADAEVKALVNDTEKATATTAQDGSYTLRNLAPGTYTVEASASKYESAKQHNVTVSSGQTTSDVNFALQLKSGEISGVVTDTAGQPLENALVEVLDDDGNVVKSANTNADGSYTVSELSPGTYTVRASRDGYVTQQIGGVVVEPGKTTSDVNFELQKAGSINGTVTDADTSEELPDVMVEVLDWRRQLVGQTYTNENGSYKVTNLPAGTYTLRFSKVGYVAKEQSNVQVQAGESETVNIALSRQKGAITGTVINSATEQPIEGVTIEVKVEDEVKYQATTGTDGSFTISDVLPDTYTVEASKEGFERSQAGVEVQAGQTTSLDFELDPLATISGRVTDAVTGATLEGATVTVKDEEGQLVGEVNTDTAGNYSIVGLSSGTYQVTIVKDGYVEQTTTVSVSPGETATVNMALEPKVQLGFAPEYFATAIGKEVTIELTVTNATNLYAISADISYNTNILEVVKDSETGEPATEGEFLNQDNKGTMFLVRSEDGRLIIAITRVGDVGGVSGSGVWARIKFRIKAEGQGIIRYESSGLKDAELQAVPHRTHTATLEGLWNPADFANETHPGIQRVDGEDLAILAAAFGFCRDDDIWKTHPILSQLGFDRINLDDTTAGSEDCINAADLAKFANEFGKERGARMVIRVARNRQPPRATLRIAPIAVIGKEVGDEFTIDVRIDNAYDVTTIGFDLLYDTSELSYVSIEEGDLLNADGVQTALLVNAKPGRIIVGIARLGAGISGVNGSGVVCRITFKVEAVKGTQLHIEKPIVVMSDGALQPTQSRSGYVNQGRSVNLSRGLHMLSIPLLTEAMWHELLNTTPEEAKVAVWDGQGYITPKDGQLTTPQAGRAVWIYLDADTTLSIPGVPIDTERPFTIPLSKGWNMIGVPWDVRWQDLKVRVGNEERSIVNATEWLQEVLWTWRDDAYEMVWDESIVNGVQSTLEQWRGYWVRALVDCELVIPPANNTKLASSRARRSSSASGWIISLSASVGNISDSGRLFGVVRKLNSKGRSIIADTPPLPPTTQQPVQLMFIDERGQALAMDIRSQMAQRCEWQFIVKARGSGQQVRLNWRNLYTAPKALSFILEDMSTGRRIYMRTNGSYSYTTQQDEPARRFRIIVERGGVGALRITSIRTTTIRGRGIGINFELTRNAFTDIEVLTLTGRRVASVEHGRSRARGANVAIWRGVADNGRRVPSGIYLIRIRARDEEGRQVQAHTICTLR